MTEGRRGDTVGVYIGGRGYPPHMGVCG